MHSQLYPVVPDVGYEFQDKCHYLADVNVDVWWHVLVGIYWLKVYGVEIFYGSYPSELGFSAWALGSDLAPWREGGLDLMEGFYFLWGLGYLCFILGLLLCLGLSKGFVLFTVKQLNVLLIFTLHLQLKIYVLLCFAQISLVFQILLLRHDVCRLS